MTHESIRASRRRTSIGEPARGLLVHWNWRKNK